MTARVCPIHGEYSASGVCRWCDADLPKAIFEPPDGVRFLVPAQSPPVRLVEVASWRTPPADGGWEEIRPDAQHAALRWERVARRWATKHPRSLSFGHPAAMAILLPWVPP